MILELVLFKNPPGMTRDAEMEAARAVVPKWLANKDLLRKHFIRSDDGYGGGVYIWPSREAAQAAHDEAWMQSVERRTGGRPEIRYFDLMIVLDTKTQEVKEFA